MKKMNHRSIFLKFSMIASAFAVIWVFTVTTAAQPNILWIIAEDMSPDLGCYGHDLTETPNIDRLAQQGTLFSHAFSTSSICVPSRSSFITGMYATSIGAHHQMLTLPAYSYSTAPKYQV
jgi:arylsulfatase A-like enzyme